MSIFEKASRLKLRFSHKGYCSVEDLWDLPLESVDAIFKQLNQQAKTQLEESLLAESTKADEELTLQLEIVRHVVKVRLEEKQQQANKLERASKKQELLAIVADKENAALKDKSIDELKGLIANLD